MPSAFTDDEISGMRSVSLVARVIFEVIDYRGLSSQFWVLFLWGYFSGSNEGETED